MKNLRVFLAICALGAGLVACGESSPAITATGAQRSDNGSGFGSGHRTDDSTTVATIDGTAVAISSSEEGATDTTTARGGSGFGSGN